MVHEKVPGSMLLQMHKNSQDFQAMQISTGLLLDKRTDAQLGQG
jgi:hypothetical protein